MEPEFPLLDDKDSVISKDEPFNCETADRPSVQHIFEVEFAKQQAVLQSLSGAIVSTIKETLKEELSSRSPLAPNRAVRHMRSPDADSPRKVSRVLSDADSYGVQSIPLGIRFQNSREESPTTPATVVAQRSAVVSNANSWESIYQHKDFRDSRKKAQAAARKISAMRASTTSLGAGEEEQQESRVWSLQAVKSPWFKVSVQLVILTNVILLGVEVDASAHLPPNTQLEGFSIANIVIVGFFFAEILLKLHAYGGQTFFFGKDKWWNWFDLTIFLMSVFEIVAEGITSFVFATQMDTSQLRTMRFLRMARALRGVRVLRLLQYLSALRTIVFSIVSTMGSVFWTSLLLVILFYLFGVLNTQIVTDHCRALKYASVPTECNPELLRFWASVPQSMLTLFLSVTNGIGWDEALQPLYGVSTVAIMSLILYIVITVLAVLNTVTGVFCNMAIESARADKEMATMRQMQKHEAQVDALRGVFEEINPDQDGMSVISLEELKEALQQEKLRSFMHSMDIATDDVVTLFMVIDADGSGDITLDEFVYGCMNLAGPAKQLQVARMGYENTIIRKEIKALRMDMRRMQRLVAVMDQTFLHLARPVPPSIPENYASVRV